MPCYTQLRQQGVCSAAALRGQPTAWGKGGVAGITALQHYGGAKPGDRTMLDALVPAINTFQAKLGSGVAFVCTPCVSMVLSLGYTLHVHVVAGAVTESDGHSSRTALIFYV